MNFKTAVLLFFAFLNISFGLLAYFKNRKSLSNITYAVFMGFVGLWSFGLAMFYFAPAENYSVFWSNFLYFMGSSIAVSFYYVSLAIPAEKPAKKITLAWPLVSIFILFVLYFFTPLMINGVIYPEGIKTFTYGRAHLLFDLHFSGLFLLAIIRLFRTLKITSGIKREQIKYVLLSTFIGVVFAGVTNVTMPSIFHNCSLVWIGPYITFIMVSIMTYAIVRYRIMDINLVIRTSVVNTIIAIVLAGVVISLSFTPGIIFRAIIIFVAMLLIAIYLPKIKARTESAVTQLLYKEKYEYQDKLEKFIEEMPYIPREEKLLKDTVTTLAETMGIKKAAIFILDNISHNYIIRNQVGMQQLEDFIIQGNKDIASWLKENREVFVKEEMEKVLKHNEFRAIRKILDKIGATVCMPILLKTDLIGIIALGEKSSGDIYSHIDTKILHRLGILLGFSLDYKHVEAELRKKEEYAAIGKLAFEITHEMKNLLVPIRTFFDLVEERKDDQEFMGDFKKVAEKNIEIIDRKVEDILFFGKGERVVFTKDVDINKILKDTVNGLKPMAKDKNIDIEEELANIPNITADNSSLVHVFNNLIINGMESMHNKTGKIRIRSKIHPHPTGQMVQYSPRWIRIEVKDDGSGINPETKDKMFDAFFTTKWGGEEMKKSGMGLGLAVVKKVIDLHNGIIGVNSELGKETTFVIDLPVEQKNYGHKT